MHFNDLDKGWILHQLIKLENPLFGNSLYKVVVSRTLPGTHCNRFHKINILIPRWWLYNNNKNNNNNICVLGVLCFWLFRIIRKVSIPLTSGINNEKQYTSIFSYYTQVNKYVNRKFTEIYWHQKGKQSSEERNSKSSRFLVK